MRGHETGLSRLNLRGHAQILVISHQRTKLPVSSSVGSVCSLLMNCKQATIPSTVTHSQLE